MNNTSTNDVHSRRFKSQLDSSFRSEGKADYKTKGNMRKRKTGGAGSKRIALEEQIKSELGERVTNAILKKIIKHSVTP